MRPAIPSNGKEYCEYLLLYTDNALCIIETADNVLQNDLGIYFPLKEVGTGTPNIYLGGHIQKVQLENIV